MLQWAHQQLNARGDVALLERQLHLNLHHLANVLATGLVATTADAAYTVTLVDDLVLADATAGGFTITLPLADEARGRSVRIKKIDASANVVTIDGAGAETIDGAASVTLTTQYQVRGMLSDGTTWWSF